MYIRVSQNAQENAKENLSDVGFENIFVVLILFIHRASNCKKPFRGFSEILSHNISYSHSVHFWDTLLYMLFFMPLIDWLITGPEYGLAERKNKAQTTLQTN